MYYVTCINVLCNNLCIIVLIVVNFIYKMTCYILDRHTVNFIPAELVSEVHRVVLLY